jgi:eukaryotic-like serine/threonine-protein kinase
LNGTPQPPTASARLIETLARNVHYAHSAGIIHRDLKPANILLQKVAGAASPLSESRCWIHDGCAYLLKIADFGLAKQVQNNSDATQTQAIVGTPSYMAPEQAGDFSRRIGPCADVYSLGAILYEMLTGRPPFRGETVLDTLDQVRTQDAIPPTRLQPRVPRDLETICLKCLRKDPAQRYPSAEALADDLGRFQRHEPIQARPASVLQKTTLWIRRRPALAALYATLLTTVFLLAFVGFPYVTYLWRQTLREKEFSQTQLYDERINKAHEYWLKTKCEPMKALLQSMRPKPGEPDRRDFEWYYLWGLLHQDLARVPADGCLAYSPDGSLLAAGARQEIHVWRTADLEKPHAQPMARLRGHTGDLVSLAFHPKGNLLLSAAKDRTVRLWDLVQHKTIHTLPVHRADVTSVAFNPGDSTTATACKDGVIRLWEADGAKRLELDEHTAAVNDIAFSADGKRLASASADRTVIIWDAATGDIVHRLTGHSGIVYCVAIHGRRIASTDFLGFLRLWDIETGKLIHTYPKMPHTVNRLAFTSDGRRLAAACFDQSIQLWDVDPQAPKFTEEPSLVIRGHVGRIDGLAFSPSGHRLASVSRDQTLRLWDPDRGIDSLVHPLPAVCHGLAICPNQPILAVAGNDANIYLWNWRTGVPGVRRGHAAPVQGVAFAADGTLASAAKDGKIRVWDINQEKMLSEFATAGDVSALEFHPSGHRLVTGTGDGVVQFWEAPGGGKRYEGPSHHGKIHDLAFSPDGRALASAGADGFVILCDSETGQELRRLSDPDHTPVSLAFSFDGLRLAAGDAQKTIRIWDLRTGRRLFRFDGHDSPVSGLAFSHNGRRLASAGDIPDGAVKLWDLTTGLELLTLRGHGRGVNSVAFTPNDEALISLGRTANLQGQLRVWDTQAGRKK